MMPSCKKATELIEKKEVFKISPVESLKLMFHTSMCHVCSNYEKQSRFLKSALEKFFKTKNENHDNIPVPEDLKAGILKKIEEEA